MNITFYRTPYSSSIYSSSSSSTVVVVVYSVELLHNCKAYTRSPVNGQDYRLVGKYRLQLSTPLNGTSRVYVLNNTNMRDDK